MIFVTVLAVWFSVGFVFLLALAGAAARRTPKPSFEYQAEAAVVLDIPDHCEETFAGEMSGVLTLSQSARLAA
jgi:hypothetical protein